MNRKDRKSKRKAKEYVPPIYGSMKYAIRAGTYDPRDVYHMKMESLKQKRDAKRICSVCGKKAEYEDKKLFKKPVYYCEKCKNELGER